MIGWTPTQETRAAIGLVLDDRAPWSDGGSAQGIGRTEDGDDGQSNSSRHVHRSGIIAKKEMALGEQSRKIGDVGLPREISRPAVHVGNDGTGDRDFRTGTEEDEVGIVFFQETVGPLSETLGRPTLS